MGCSSPTQCALANRNHNSVQFVHSQLTLYQITYGTRYSVLAEEIIVNLSFSRRPREEDFTLFKSVSLMRIFVYDSLVWYCLAHWFIDWLHVCAGAGNCLDVACAIAMWGSSSPANLLRRLIYVTLVEFGWMRYIDRWRRELCTQEGSADCLQVNYMIVYIYLLNWYQ